jgi:gliding motility-associated-like protein
VYNTDYCYQLETNYSNGSKSISLEKCGTAFSTDIPTAIENVTAVVGTSTVDLTWLQDPAFQTTGYNVFRKSGGGGFNLLTTSSTNQASDVEYTTEESYCYRINYKDACENNSADGIEACPIRLSGTVASNNSIKLSWSAYTGWKNGVDHYIIEKYDAQGALLETIDNITSTTYDDVTVDLDNQIYSYIVKAVANDPGFGEAVSNQTTEIKEPNIYYPTAFTPDGVGDIRNEAFKVFGQFVEIFEMNIFNRWGELLFTTTDINLGWNGNFRGKPQPEGTYAFSVIHTDFKGRTFKRSGSFVLLRKK